MEITVTTTSRNCREEIQRAIDAAARAGGGTVFLPGNKTYVTASLVLRSGVTLLLGENAVLQQTGDENAYVKPASTSPDCFDYVPYVPKKGHNFSPEIKWSHNWYHNYPFLYAPEGSRDFAIRGKGVIRMMDCASGDDCMKLCPIGFFRCRDFTVEDVHITNFHSYAIMPFSCSGGLFKNLTIDEWSFGNGDGVCMMNCRDMRVTGCKMHTGDDSVYIFSSYRDPRRSEWWNSDEPQASENIEIDHNDLRSNHCKAFGMILWGIDCPEQEKIEVRNVYVHDNHFVTLGNWNYDPYTVRQGHPPVTDMRFENNVIDAIERNFFETHISGLKGFPCMTELKNTEFRDGRCFWMTEGDVRFIRGAEEPYCALRSEGGRSAVWQGIFIEAGRPAEFWARADATEGTYLFVRDENDNLIARREILPGEGMANRLGFTVPTDGNYRIGIETDGAAPREAKIRQTVLGSFGRKYPFDHIIYDPREPHKMLFAAKGVSAEDL
ncbi:MAG: hypothetical protein IJL26_06460 [Clostridia bacterium]|nr:hypothetical protein [Clostridia bacterium]